MCACVHVCMFVCLSACVSIHVRLPCSSIHLLEPTRSRLHGSRCSTSGIIKHHTENVPRAPRHVDIFDVILIQRGVDRDTLARLVEICYRRYEMGLTIDYTSQRHPLILLAHNVRSDAPP